MTLTVTPKGKQRSNSSHSCSKIKILIKINNILEIKKHKVNLQQEDEAISALLCYNNTLTKPEYQALDLTKKPYMDRFRKALHIAVIIGEKRTRKTHYIRQFPTADLYASPGHHFQEAATALDPTKRVLYDLEDSAVRLQLETKWICKGQQRIEILPLSHGFSEMLIYVHDHKLIYFNDCLIGSSMSHNFITSVLFDANHKLGLAIQEYDVVFWSWSRR